MKGGGGEELTRSIERVSSSPVVRPSSVRVLMAATGSAII